ncbi:MAG: N-formylglutamate deformylase [Gammaproteobacteria bacterium]|nr:N-formylglutamate deformylase [Gammaproteobacteria bacterium]
MDTFEFKAGTTPLLISMPHNGTAIPEDLATRMTDHARTVPDTDWHLDRLYDFAGTLGAGVLNPVYSRYVVDLNRPPDGSVLYPGASNTELCPLSCFDMSPIYRGGEEPGPDEVAERVESYWRPYHDQLERELSRLKAEHGVAVLYEAHSIRSQVPRFFEGRLPDLNLGTASGASCNRRLQKLLRGVLESAKGYTFAVNRRFKGGYNTRHYGNPKGNVHAVQLEQAQISYMEESYPFAYDDERAKKVKPVLRQLLETVLAWASERK